MNAHAINPVFLKLPVLAAGIAAILIGAIAVAALMITAQTANGEAAPAAAEDVAPAIVVPGAVHGYRCDECGVIESMRVVEAQAEKSGAAASGRTTPRHDATGADQPRSYEITIRLQDGTMRVIRDAKPAHWRHGEQVTIIAGADQ